MYIDKRCILFLIANIFIIFTNFCFATDSIISISRSKEKVGYYKVSNKYIFVKTIKAIDSKSLNSYGITVVVAKNSEDKYILEHLNTNENIYRKHNNYDENLLLQNSNVEFITPLLYSSSKYENNVKSLREYIILPKNSIRVCTNDISIINRFKKTLGFKKVINYSKNMKVIIIDKMSPFNAFEIAARLEKEKAIECAYPEIRFRKGGNLPSITHRNQDIITKTSDKGVILIAKNKQNLQNLQKTKIKNKISMKVNRILKKTKPLMHGKDVREIQSALMKLGYSVKIDGFYGNETFSSVRKFQKANNLECTGNIDINTRKLLIELASSIKSASSTKNKKGNLITDAKQKILMLKKPFMKGKEVSGLQNGLKQIGYFLKCDGIYGKETYNTVKKFQEDNDIEVTGVFNEKTRNILLNKIQKKSTSRFLNQNE